MWIQNNKGCRHKKRLLYTMQWPKAFSQLFCIEIPIYVDVFSCYNEKRSMHVVWQSSVLFWENKCKASSKLVWEKLCHFYYFKQGRVMFLFSDIISTQKLMDFLTQFSNKKLVCFRHFFYFQNWKYFCKIALQLYKF